MLLTRDQILAKRAELPKESVEIPELGGSVLIRILTLKEVREIQKLQNTTKENLAIYPRLVALGCVNDDGSALFVGEDFKLNDELPWAATDAIARAVLRINKMTEEESTNGAPKD